MDIKAAVARRSEDRLRQNQSISSDHRYIRADRGEVSLLLDALQRARTADIQAKLTGSYLDRGWPVALAASRRPWRLGVDGGDVMASPKQRVERRHGKVGAAHENDPHWPAMARCSHLAQARAV